MRIVALLVAFLIGSGALAHAGDDVAAGRAVIQSQQDAFSHDDGAAAYTFASPALQSFFHTPETFMFMVRNGYAPVYRNKSFEFGEARVIDGKIVQDVQILDADGAAWDARYTLEPQPDGSLKISSCVLVKAVTS
jgi:hypothetical protein